MKRLSIALIAALAGLALAAPAGTAVAGHGKGHGQHGHGKSHGKGHSNGHGNKGGPKGGGDVEVSVYFGDGGLIADFYGHHPKARKKYKPLPPGIRKNLARGKPLPPGIAKQTLPEDLEERLPPLPHGYARFVVGESLVVVDADGIVVEIFADF